ncbi:4Fe-4S dicluster domain-containing protein [Heliorestis acidaminivorans]|uniref:4Fe-4S dicluster domain-containing protein n=1 Tax=Heliorestis acidaminivorans TaxID=553427 RepID=A0A6I0F3Y3_9FIRM|nr:4Fe-4S dicluster domain-containing protein [Heliorestis acidaminivorans]KAB2953282.1 4Fe-4S dicluster domain-containing protein [Heliorestis acidaminivorans]
MARRFETTVQLLRHEVLVEVARMAMSGTVERDKEMIPYVVVQGKRARFRCCVYKERAVVKQRVELACGIGVDGTEACKSGELIQVLETGCDECPVDRFTVTEACRGCISHPCMESCPVDAIIQINRRAYINQEKCIECGRCHSACPYDAIADTQRPCIRACPVNAIDFGEDKIARIKKDKCIYCGLCALRCPFGAIADVSCIIQVVEALKKKDEAPVHVVLAPSIVAQFEDLSMEQIHGALIKLGFAAVHEAALGADMILAEEAEEVVEKVREGSFLTSSCCPAFVQIIRKHFPELEDNISTSVSPMIAVGRYVKKHHPDAVTVFIGPCIAKKMEARQSDRNDAIDYAITFEEMLALFVASDIEPAECTPVPLEQSSVFGRAFARCGGVGEAVAQAVKEYNLPLEVTPVKCDGAAECVKALRMAKAGRPPGNFIEGMACVNGCVGGPSSFNHKAKAKRMVDEHSKKAILKTITEATSILK